MSDAEGFIFRRLDEEKERRKISMENGEKTLEIIELSADPTTKMEIERFTQEFVNIIRRRLPSVTDNEMRSYLNESLTRYEEDEKRARSQT